MLDLPLYIPIVFIITVIATFLIFIYAVYSSGRNISEVYITAAILIAWLLFQLVLSLRGFYSTNTRSIPPHFAFLILPPVLFIIALFATARGRSFIDSLPIVTLTFLSIVRIPVEITLYWLCLYHFVPELMTYNGRNWDLISGNTAPFVAYAIYKGLIGKKVILAWNLIALCLLLNIVVNAVLSVPLAFQQFAFDQPNVALLYFPFIWLPSFVVPIVLFTHLVSIRRMLIKKNNSF